MKLNNILAPGRRQGGVMHALDGGQMKAFLSNKFCTATKNTWLIDIKDLDIHKQESFSS